MGLSKRVKKKQYMVDVLRLARVKRRDADRIAGGMLRLEGSCVYWPQFVKASLDLAETPEETSLIWYLIGIKIGIMSEHGMISSFGNKIIKGVSGDNGRPEIQ